MDSMFNKALRLYRQSKNSNNSLINQSLQGGDSLLGGSLLGGSASQQPDPTTEEQMVDLGRQLQNYEDRFNAVGAQMPEYHEEAEDSFIKKLLLGYDGKLPYLDRPRNALWNAVEDVATDDNGFFQGLKEGWTSEERYEGSDLTDDFYQSLGVGDLDAIEDDPQRWGAKFLKGALGFGAEVVADPLDLVSLGAGSLAKGFLSGAGRTMSDDVIQAMSKNATKFLNDLDTPTTMLRRATGANKVDLSDDVLDFYNTTVRRSGDQSLNSLIMGDDKTNYVIDKLNDLKNQYKGVAPVENKIDDYMRQFKENLRLKNKPIDDLAGQAQEDIRETIFDVTKNSQDILENQMGKRGLGIGVGNNRLEPFTGAQMQDLGARASQRLRDLGKNPDASLPAQLAGNTWAKAQDTIGTVFSQHYAKNLDNTSRNILKQLYTDKDALMRAQNQSIEQTVKKLSDEIVEDIKKENPGISASKLATERAKREKAITYAMSPESTYMLDDEMRELVEKDSIKRMAKRIQNKFLDMGYKEAQLGALSKVDDDYVAFLKNLDLTGEGTDKGIYAMNMNVRNKFAQAGITGNDILPANIYMRLQSSSQNSLERFSNALWATDEELHGKIFSDAGKLAVRKSSDNKIDMEVIGELWQKTHDPDSPIPREVWDLLDGEEHFFENSALRLYLARAKQHNDVLASQGLVDSIFATLGEKVPKMDRGTVNNFLNEGKSVVVTKSWAENLHRKVLDMDDLPDGDKENVLSVLETLFTKEKYRVRPGDFEEARKTLANYGIDPGQVKRGSVDLPSNLTKEQMNRLRKSIDTISQYGKQTQNKDVIKLAQGMYRTPGTGVEGLGAVPFREMTPRTMALLEDTLGEVFVRNVEGYAVPKGVLEFYNKSIQHQMGDFERIFGGALDAFHRVWKPLVTGWRPDFHLRNMASSKVNDAMDIGFRTLDPKLNKMGHKVAKGSDEIIEVAGHKMKASEVQQAMEESGAMSTMLRALYKDPKHKLAQGVVEVGTDSPARKTYDKAMQMPRAVGNAIEDNVRATNYLANLEKALDNGMDLHSAKRFAGEQVKMYHFDYTALSDTERRVFRRIMPFYSWSRKNIPLQIQHILDNPAMYARPERLKRNLEHEAGITPEQSAQMPSWAKENIPIPLMGSDDEGNQYYLSGIFPQSDLFRLDPGKMMNDVLTQVTPPVKSMYELGTNTNSLTGAPIWESRYTKTGDILDYLMRQAGSVRNISRMVSGEGDDAGAFSSIDTPVSPTIGGTLLKEFDVDEATINNLYEYLRQARAYKNEVEKETGQPLPSVYDIR